MASRLKLQEDLERILNSRNVYFQPPESIKINYPCIIYNLSNERPIYADNKEYKSLKLYTVTVIDKNPDSLIPDKLKKSFQYCRFDRPYTTNNLNHFVFSLFY